MELYSEYFHEICNFETFSLDGSHEYHASHCTMTGAPIREVHIYIHLNLFPITNPLLTQIYIRIMSIYVNYVRMFVHFTDIHVHVIFHFCTYLTDPRHPFTVVCRCDPTGCPLLPVAWSSPTFNFLSQMVKLVACG